MIEHLAGALLSATLHTTSAPVPYWKRVSAHYYDSRYEKFRRCVVKRESEGIPTVVNVRGNSYGLYQFKGFWQPILVKALHTPKLRHVPINRWDPKIQTAAFWWTLHKYGWTPWAGGRWDCTRYLP